LFRISVGLAVLVAGTAIYAPSVLYTTSSEAILNARFVTLAAPIAGRITRPPPAEGTMVAAGSSLLTIDNPTLDESRLTELETSRTHTATELAAQRELIETLDHQLATLDAQVSEYRASTVATLELLAREAAAAAVAARATATEAQHSYQRKYALRTSAGTSEADLDHAEQTAVRTDADAQRMELVPQRLAEQIGAAKQGIYVGQDRNDVPYSQQRADEFRLRRAEAQAQVSALTLRLDQLDRQVAIEQARVARLSSAKLHAPVGGVVWRPMVLAGSAVAGETELMSLIDCSQLYATATFNARRFDDFRPGGRALIHVLGSDSNLTGTVVDIRALERSDAEERFAAPLPRLGDRQILAIIRVDNPQAMATEKYCNVGRRVEVRFNSLADARGAAPDAANAAGQ
jgi:multidrug resistance efflux pump